MVECENYVEVVVSGPKDQLDIYADWLRGSGEYVNGTYFEKTINRADLFLTSDLNEDKIWHLASSNLKRKIRTYKNRKMDYLEFRVNYTVLFGAHVLENGETLDNDISNYPNGVYDGLVQNFNPLPSNILKRCKDLKATVEWGSYYIKNSYNTYPYEDEFKQNLV